MTNDERELREAFSRLKQEDRGRVPPFRTSAARAMTRRSWSPRIALAAAIVLIALVLARPDRAPTHPSRHSVDLGVVAWRSPTDFLLITPGSEMLRTVPTVGSPDDWTPIDGRGRLPAPESTHFERTPS